jgi:hypothetical protein
MSQQGNRLVYRNAVKSMIRAGVDPKSAILSQSYLRLERTITTTTTNYQFGVLVNDTPQGSAIQSTEVRLNLQDSFFVSSVSMFIGLQTSAYGSTNFPLYPYPNPHVFSANIGTSTSTANQLWNLYNGYLSLTVNNRVITPNFDLFKHYDARTTQQNATLTATAGTVDEMSGDNSTSVDVEPNWVLIGSKNNNLTLQLPGAVANVEGSSAVTKIVLILRGVLGQNTTVVS